MPYRDLIDGIDSDNPRTELIISCPMCGLDLRAYRRDYLHTMTKHRFACKSCRVDISIKTEKEND